MMDRFTKENLPALFEALRDVFTAQREALIALDGKVGDSDLGITMNKAFIAAYESVRNNAADPIGKTLQLAGMAVAKAAPSTMGTLVATGFMRGGKAQLGDKTLLDVLSPIAVSLESSSASNSSLADALEHAAQAARDGLEATKRMMAQHGKAACFQEKTVGLQDAGATVGVLMIETMHAYAVQSRSNT